MRQFYAVFLICVLLPQGSSQGLSLSASEPTPGALSIALTNVPANGTIGHLVASLDTSLSPGAGTWLGLSIDSLALSLIANSGSAPYPLAFNPQTTTLFPSVPFVFPGPFPSGLSMDLLAVVQQSNGAFQYALDRISFGSLSLIGGESVLGSAVLTTTPTGAVVVSGIGTSGADGVSFTPTPAQSAMLATAQSASFGLSPINLSQIGSTFQFQAPGVFGPSFTSGWPSCSNNNGMITLSFTPPPGCNVILEFEQLDPAVPGGTFTTTCFHTGGSIATVSPGSQGGMPKINQCSYEDMATGLSGLCVGVTVPADFTFLPGSFCFPTNPSVISDVVSVKVRPDGCSSGTVAPPNGFAFTAASMSSFTVLSASIP